MRRNIFDAIAAALRNGIDGAALAFCKLARIQFEAPWRASREC